MALYSLSSPTLVSRKPSNLSSTLPRRTKFPNPKQCIRIHGTGRVENHGMRAVSEIAAATEPAHVEITWQIVVGALAGVVPFVVAGYEFSKRIVAQRQCKVCGGSGLVLREKYYLRCPGCGGFLPWQSWKRFFSG